VDTSSLLRRRRHILVGVTDPVRAGHLAHAFQSQATAPTLAFTQEQIVEELVDDRYRMLVIDGALADHSFLSTVDSVRPRAHLPVVAIGHESQGQDPIMELVDLWLDKDTPPALVAGTGMKLLALTRPVREPARIEWGPLSLNLARREATFGERAVNLTPIQFRLLEILILAGGDVVTSAQLSRRLWGPNAFDDAERVLAHVRRIRKKIEPTPSKARFLLTVRGEGYRLADANPVEQDIDVNGLQHEAQVT
jgi:DNA-binding response OmpR family regulator